MRCRECACQEDVKGLGTPVSLGEHQRGPQGFPWGLPGKPCGFKGVEVIGLCGTQPMQGAHLGEGPEPWLPCWCSEERGTQRVLLHEACAGLVPHPPKINPLGSRAQLRGFTGLSLPGSQGKTHVSTVRARLLEALGWGQEEGLESH